MSKELSVYSRLRQAHSLIKSLYDSKDFDSLSAELKNAIDGVHAVLYMAEYVAVFEDIGVKIPKNKK